MDDFIKIKNTKVSIDKKTDLMNDIRGKKFKAND